MPFTYIPIVTLTVERGTVTFWHGIHSSAVLLNHPLQPPWHPHPPQVTYFIVKNVFCIFFRVFCCCFFSHCKGMCIDTEVKELLKAVSYVISNTRQ